MRFEIRYFFSWDWVKPEGLNPISRKKYLISNLITYFRFPRACVRNYTMRALLYMSFYMKSQCLTLHYKYSTSHTNIWVSHTFWGGVGVGGGGFWSFPTCIKLKSLWKVVISTSPTYVILTRRIFTPSTFTQTALEKGRLETAGMREARTFLIYRLVYGWFWTEKWYHHKCLHWSLFS